jgi:GT2 family glycosyltransferase
MTDPDRVDVSIIIVSRNRGRDLYRCLTSLAV